MSDSAGTGFLPDRVPAIDWAGMTPYASAVVLEIADDTVGPLVGRMVSYLAAPRARGVTAREVVAAGQLTTVEMTYVNGIGSIVEEGFEEIAAMVRRAETGGEDLTVALRRGPLVAVHCADPAMRDQLLAWVDQTPSLGLRRVSPRLLEACLCPAVPAPRMWTRSSVESFEGYLFRLSERMDLIAQRMAYELMPS
ncbi:hypothetical protein [Actinokineospora inagensis]|uniref:hypothetical protein n=1 Tax=Actinokineospora inagensis TaxID=103730 RepID=UPI0012F78CFC|nr:hypothetical protein [Actinokineospora inagensis]